MSEPDSASETPGRFAYEGLERAMHEKARLGIMTSLVTHPEGLLFNDLKDLCSLTDGNLNRHLKVLHDEGLIEIRKGTGRKRPQTVCRVTAGGRQRFLEYVSELERVVADAAAAAQARSRSGKTAASRNRLGWSPA
jgi:DNA-binding MarR family transcriptional regulator